VEQDVAAWSQPTAIFIWAFIRPSNGQCMSPTTHGERAEPAFPHDVRDAPPAVSNEFRVLLALTRLGRYRVFVRGASGDTGSLLHHHPWLSG
jgi:hypothetical protein